ncbi:MAG: alpha/beta hydrolase-fold protein [Solirubrobacteraceae bacterium]
MERRTRDAVARRRRRRAVIRRRRWLVLAIAAPLAVGASAAGVTVAQLSSGPTSARAATGARAARGRSAGPGDAGELAEAARTPARTVSVSCPSPSLGGTLPALVYLPAGYRSTGARYPVVYFLHGLPAGPAAYTQDGFVAQALVAADERAIVVAPQGARRVDSDREYLDWGPTEDWPAAIADDLPRCVDARYRTIANRHGRVLAGLSAGGYGAFNIGLRNLAVFAAVESWSGYFVATDPTGYHVLDLGSTAADSAATVPRGSQLTAELSTWPALIGFYVGNQDARFLVMNEQFDAALSAGDIPHIFRVYPGGHSETLWRALAPRWLAMALDALPTERRAAG